NPNNYVALKGQWLELYRDAMYYVSTCFCIALSGRLIEGYGPRRGAAGCYALPLSGRKIQ
ncbi:MAG: hypothetical protein LBC74_06215, partial [Planctomycetaceae bacterium]|nr:hypothetical protein [Planctomycetaceae bacterium]